MKIILLICIAISLTACDSEAEKPKNDHVWKTQTDALQKTKNLAKQLDEEFKKKMQQMENAQE